MPISENELMWNRALPEEVEADPRAVVSDAPTMEPLTEAELTADDAATEAVSETDGSDEEEPVVRVEGASRLEATLARLEMNSLQIKLHLDLLEQRIGRIEPAPQQGPQSSAELVADLRALRVATEVHSADVVQHGVTPEQTLGVEPAIREARSDRWSHLMGPETDARVPVFPAVQTVQAVSTHDIEPTPIQPMSAEPMSAVPEHREAAAMSAVRTIPAAAPGSSTVPPATRRPPVGQAPDSFAAPVTAVFPRPRAETDEAAEERFPPRRMFAVDPYQAEPAAPVQSPGMWRGYRVRTLVLAALLLVLAAIPLAIWWRLSVEARDADTGDAAPLSEVDPATSASPAGRNRAPTAGTRHAPPARTSESAVASLGSADHATGSAGHVIGAAAPTAGTAGPMTGAAVPIPGTAGISQGRAAGAPVVRVSPAAPSARSSVPIRPSTRPADGRTSGGTAAVGGTAIAKVNPSSASEEVPGASGPRVRVPEGVMAGHLLPTGDQGELPHGSGEVVAAMFISNTGRVEEVQVISGTHGLRDVATRTMRNWRYEPYVQDGVRVPVVTTASIRFDGASSEAQ